MAVHFHCSDAALSRHSIERSFSPRNCGLTGIEGFSRRKPVVVRTNAQPGSGVAWPAATLSPQMGFAAVGVAGPTAPLSPTQ